MPIKNTLIYISFYFLMFLTLVSAWTASKTTVTTGSKTTVTYDYILVIHSIPRTSSFGYNYHFDIFSKNVTTHLNSGWELSGSMNFDRQHSSGTYYLIQPVVKKTIINIL